MRKWYIAQTYSGYENSVKTDIERRIESMNYGHLIYQVLVPEEKYQETKKDGSVVEKTRKLFPGYIFVEMEVDPAVGMDSDAWFMIRNTPQVTGFLGSSGKGTKPTPVRKDEMDQILRSIGLLEKQVLDIAVGQKVEVTSGTWRGQIGEISNINEEKGIVTVLIDMFGRQTPTELGINDVKKIG